MAGKEDSMATVLRIECLGPWRGYESGCRETSWRLSQSSGQEMVRVGGSSVVAVEVVGRTWQIQEIFSRKSQPAFVDRLDM